MKNDMILLEVARKMKDEPEVEAELGDEDEDEDEPTVCPHCGEEIE